MTTPITQRDVDEQAARVAALNQQIADGVRQVTHGDESVTFNTTDSLIRARDDAQAILVKMRRDLQAATSPSPAPKARVVYYFQDGRGYW